MPNTYRTGDLVRGAIGRPSENWKGRIVKARDGGYVVDWDGRRNHESPLVRKRPELFMLTEQLRPYQDPDKQLPSYD